MNAPHAPAANTRSDLTRLLRQWSDRDDALERVLPLVYDQLRAAASHYLRSESEACTLHTTALVHEVYLKLANQPNARFEHKAQFFSLAGQMIRHILVQHARRRLAGKRGAGAVHIALDCLPEAGPSRPIDAGELLALDDALERLAAIHPRQSRIVTLHFFAGMTFDEIAEVLDVSPSTVVRDWRVARCWLSHALSGAHAAIA